jgi:hypothetical protein
MSAENFCPERSHNYQGRPLKYGAGAPCGSLWSLARREREDVRFNPTTMVQLVFPETMTR